MLALKQGARRRRSRLVLAVVVSGVIAPSVALAATQTGSCPAGSAAGSDYCQLIPTKLVASPVLPGGVSAVLTRTDTGAPIPGQKLTFTAGKKLLCTAVTNSAGKASCTSVTAVLLALLNLGYTVTYAGNATYCPASAHGSAVALGTLVVSGKNAKKTNRKHAHSAAADAHLRAQLRAIGTKRLERKLLRLRAGRAQG